MPSLAEVLTGKADPSKAIQPLGNGLAILPATITLADIELELASRPSRELMLKRALTRVTGYDLALIDCGPGIGILTLNALVAAHGVIVPTQPQAQDLRGLSLFLHTIDAVREELNPGLQLIGIVPTFYQPQLLHHSAAMQEIKASGLKVLHAIGRTVRIAEASAAQLPITRYEPNSPQALAYHELGKEIERWLKQNPV